MKAAYTVAVQDAMSSGIGWLSGTVNVLAVSTGYTFDAAHANLSDIPLIDRLGSTAITGRTLVAGVGDGNDVVVATSPGLTLGGLILHHDSGVEATSRLIAFSDEDEGGVPISGTTTGDGLVIPWATDGIVAVVSVDA